ncbi:MAG: tol-pal system protein YbgF [bacterium]
MLIIRNGLIGIFSCIFSCLVCGCATSHDMRAIDSSVETLQRSQDALQANQADLSAQMIGLNDTMSALTEQLIDSRERMSLLSQKLDDIEANFSGRMDDLSRQLSGSPQSTEPIPSEIYRIGYNDFIRSRYDLASIQFRRYLERYPQGELAGKAKFYLAECLYLKEKWEEAIVQYNEMIKSYPAHEFVPEAMLKKGMSLQKIKKPKEAVSVYQSLIDTHPSSMAAEKADEILKSSAGSSKVKNKPEKLQIQEKAPE